MNLFEFRCTEHGCDTQQMKFLYCQRLFPTDQKQIHVSNAQEKCPFTHRSDVQNLYHPVNHLSSDLLTNYIWVTWDRS